MFKMNGATWSVGVGFLVFIIGVIFALIYYFRYKKIYLLSFILSIVVYVFAVFYTWDVFELEKNGIFLLLITSTIIMIFVGKYFSTFSLESDDEKNKNK